MGQVNRRDLLLSGAAMSLLLLGPLPALAAPAIPFDAAQMRVLVRMARLLYPLDKLSDSVYREIVDAIVMEQAGDPEAVKIFNAGILSLDYSRPKKWLDL